MTIPSGAAQATKLGPTPSVRAWAAKARSDWTTWSKGEAGATARAGVAAAIARVRPRRAAIDLVRMGVLALLALRGQGCPIAPADASAVRPAAGSARSTAPWKWLPLRRNPPPTR